MKTLTVARLLARPAASGRAAIGLPLVAFGAAYFGASSALSATQRNALCRGSGNTFPLFAARRRIPAQAFGLNQYRAAIGPVSSIEDSEHALAPLRQSEELRVQHAPLDESVWTERHAFRLPLDPLGVGD